MLAKKQIKTVMIPTTCGTGSEATCNAIVAVPEEQSKKGIVNDSMIPVSYTHLLWKRICRETVLWQGRIFPVSIY